MTEPDGERIARLETEVRHVRGSLQDLSNKMDKVQETVTGQDATRTFVWKMVGASSSIAAAVATIAMTFI